MLLFSVQFLLCISSFVTSSLAVPTTEPPIQQQVLLPNQYELEPTPLPSLFTRIRDGLIRSIWKNHKSSSSTRTTTSRAPCPSKLQSYGDDVVLRFKLNSEKEAVAFAEAVDTLFLDVWEATRDWADVRLSRKVLPSLLNLLPDSMQQSHTPVITHLSQAVYETFPEQRRTGHSRHQISASLRHDLFFDNYQPLSVIYPWLRLIASMFSERTQLFTIGTSFEGRDIPALRLGLPPDENDPHKDDPRETILITAGSHAREWISTSTATYILHSFVRDFDPIHHQVIEKILKHYDVIFIPVLNPDGYEYTWTTDRLWRKNRQETTLPFCRGIDLDRSFPFGWDGDSQIDNPCSESYAGEHPLQAVEAIRLTDWARNETAEGKRVFSALIDLHSYSQEILYPYSYTCDRQPHNLEDLEEIALGLAKAFRLTNGHYYEVDSACEGTMSVTPPTSNKAQADKIRVKLEESGGSALDFFYSEMQVKYAFQIKLRDTGTYGFLLPKENIVPTGMETFGAVLGLGRWLLGNRGIEGFTDLSSDLIWGLSNTETESSNSSTVDEKGEENENDQEEEVYWWQRRRR